MPVLHIPFFYIGSVHFPRWFHTFIYFSVWFPVARAVFFFYPLTISSFASPHRFGAICFYSMSAAPSSASTLLSCPPRSSLYSLFFTFFCFVLFAWSFILCPLFSSHGVSVWLDLFFFRVVWLFTERVGVWYTAVLPQASVYFLLTWIPDCLYWYFLS